ncbi:MAG: aldehyde dehydrogenase family protein [Planctomycetota bacterium]
MSLLTKLPLVGGRPVASGKTRDITNPYNSALVGAVDDATQEIVLLAIAAAEEGARRMLTLTAHQRGDFLDGAAALLGRRAAEAASIICSESGKPIRDARAEVARCMTTLKLSAEEARRIGGELLPLDAAPNGAGRTGITKRFPIGIVTAITPFNFPLNLAAHKAGPALASGNSIILKPAPRTPLSCFLLAEILLEAGCPPEAVSVVTGDPPVFDALITDPRIAMVSFTGGGAAGWNIKERAPKKKVTLELGGNAAAIVHTDADIKNAAARCVAGSFTFAGQVCIRSQRILIHNSVFDIFMKDFAERTRALRTGDPAAETTDIGPMIDAAAAARAWSWVEEARAAGAILVCGGPPAGAFLPPAILTNVPHGCRAYCEEIFAPVSVVDRYENIGDAIAIVNDSRFGLQAGIFTNSVDVLMRAFEQLRVGAVIHNDVPAFRADLMPYGGVKDSGFGREGVRDAIREMTDVRLLALRPDPKI